MDNELAGWFGIATILMGMVTYVVQRMRSHINNTDGKELYPESLHVVAVENGEFVVRRPTGETTRLPVSELRGISILTNDSGPWGADVWWCLLGADEGTMCAFPGGATGESAILAFVQDLPGFDNAQFIQAMGSTSNARFVCWQRGSAPTDQPAISKPRPEEKRLS